VISAAITVQDTEMLTLMQASAREMEGVRNVRTWLLGPCLTIILANNELQFASEGRRYGSQWQGLSPRTQKVRKSRGYGPQHPILRQTDALFHMATTRGGGLVATAWSSTLHIDFSAVPYGINHLAGMMDNGPMPIRRWLPPEEGTPTIRRQMEGSFAKELERRAAKNLRKRLRNAKVTET
jgi:hypothetical protein